MMNHFANGAKIAIAALLILSSTGCDDGKRLRLSVFFCKCDKATKTLQVYTGEYSPDDGDFVDEAKRNSRLNGKPCSSSGEGKPRPYTMGPASKALFQIIGFPPDQSKKPLQAPAAVPVFSPLKLFPWLAPILFNPNPAVRSGQTLPLECPSNLGGFMVNHLQNTVTAFAICPLRQVKEIFVAPNPLQVAVTPDESLALVTSYGNSDGGALTFINTETGAVTATMQLLNYNPSGIAISPDGARAYLTHYLDMSPSIIVVDIANRRVLSTIPLPFPYPRVITLTPDGSQAWVNYYQGGSVTVVDLLTATVAGTVSITQPVSMGMVFNSAGTKAFIAVDPNQLYVIDTATLAIKKRITVGQAPSDVVITADGNFVLLNSDVENGTWWVDARNDKLLGRSKDPTDTTGGTMGLMVFQ